MTKYKDAYTEVYEILEQLDEEEYNKETLAMELETLEKKCTKKGLDYEAEKAKYLAKKEKKKS